MPPSAPSGVMVCLPIPRAVARDIAVPGGEAADTLHVTLAYVPGIAGDFEKRKLLAAAVELLTPNFGALKGMIGGYGRFNGSETSDFKDVFYASFDAPGLEQLRQAVVEALFRAGLQPSTKHGFTPHITLCYLDKDQEIPEHNLYGLPPFYVDRIALGDRDGIEEFEFTGSFVLKGGPTASSVHVKSPLGKSEGDDEQDDEQDDGKKKTPPAAEPTIQEPGWQTPPEDNLEVEVGAKYAEELAAAALSASGQRNVKKSSLVTVHKDSSSEGYVAICKTKLDKQICYGVVLEPDTEDLQEDSITEEEIEKTAHGYMERARKIHDRHGPEAAAFPVESYIAPQDLHFSSGPYGPQVIKKGSWVLGVKVSDPELWRKIEAGEYTGFSVGGVGMRDPI